MLHQDYLVRMFSQLAAAIRESILKARGGQDPEAAAALLEASLANATEVDGSILLTLAPDSMVAMLQLSETDPRLVSYVARTLLLESQYLAEAQQNSLSALREEQAYALSRAYDFDLTASSLEEGELEAFFESAKIE